MAVGRGGRVSRRIQRVSNCSCNARSMNNGTYNDGLTAAPTRTMNSASTILRALFILLRVHAVFGLYATLKALRSSSSS